MTHDGAATRIGIGDVVEGSRSRLRSRFRSKVEGGGKDWQQQGYRGVQGRWDLLDGIVKSDWYRGAGMGMALAGSQSVWMSKWIDFFCLCRKNNGPRSAESVVKSDVMTEFFFPLAAFAPRWCYLSSHSSVRLIVEMTLGGFGAGGCGLD